MAGLVQDPAIASTRRSLLPLFLRESNGATVPVGALADRLFEERVILVAGPPGSGKSTLLSSLAYDYALYALNYGEADLAQCVLCEERRLPVVVAGFGFRVAGSWLGSGFRVPGSEGKGGVGVPAVVIVDGPERPLTFEEKRELTGWVEEVARSGEDVRVVVGLRESDLPVPLMQMGVVWRCESLSAAAAAVLMEAHLGEGAARLAGALAGWDLWDLTRGPRLLALLCELASTREWTSRGAMMRALLARLQDDSAQPPFGQGEGGRGKGEGDGALMLGEGNPVARQASSQVERAWQGGGGRLLAGLIHCGAMTQEPRGGGTWVNPVLRDCLAALGLGEEIVAGKELAPLIAGSLEDWSRPLSLAQEFAGGTPALLDYLLQQDPAAGAPGLAVRCARDGGVEALLVQRATLLGPWRGLAPLARELNRAGLFRESKALVEQARVRADAGTVDTLADLAGVLAEARAGLGLPPGHEHGAAVKDLDGPAFVAAFDRERKALSAEEARACWLEGQAKLLQMVVEWELLGAQMATEAGRSGEALRRIARASRLAQLPGQWRRCGDLYDRLGRPSFAAALWERAARAAEGEPEGLLARSRQAEAAGRLEEACRLMARAAGIRGTEPDLLVEEACLLQRAGSVLLARTRLERCLWLRQDYPPALATMGELLLGAGKVQEGLGFLRRATEAAPYDAGLWGRLAMGLIETGKVRDGEEALRAALERQPARPDWLNRLGLLLLESRRQDEALGLFDAALAQAPRHPVYRYNRAMALAARAADVPGGEEEALGEFAALTAPLGLAWSGRSGAAESDLTPTPSLQGKGGDAGVEVPREAMLWNTVAAEAHRQRGLIFDRRGDFARAVEEFQRAGVLVPEQPDYRLLESLAWGRLEDPSRRMALLRQATEMWPLDASVLLRLGEALEGEGEVAEALVRYRRATELDPGQGEVWLARGRAERLAGQLDAARGSLERGLAVLPRDARVRKEIGLVLEETGAAEDAYRCYREAARMTASDASLWVCVGRLARRLDRPAESLAALRTAAGLDRATAEPHVELGLTLAQQGRYEEALGELREALARDPTHALAHYHLALLARRLGRGDEGEQHLACARSLGLAAARDGQETGGLTGDKKAGRPADPHPALSQRERASAEEAGSGGTGQTRLLPEMRRLLEVGDVGLALALVTSAARQGVLGGIGLGRLTAEARERQGDLEGALAALVAADAATPSDLRWRALLLSSMGSHERALEAVRLAGRGQQWPALWRDQAAMLAAQGAWREAAELYERALAEAHDLPADERAWWLLEAGDVRRKLGDAAGALERYDRGISCGGPQAGLWRRCAEVQAEMGRPGEALDALGQATTLDPADHAAWFLMAETLRGQGDTVRALEAVAKACDARPQSPEYALTRGRLLRSLGRGGEAIRWLREAAQRLPEVSLAWSDLGWALLGEDDLERAEESFGKGLAGDPELVPCLCGLARVRQRQGRGEEALDLARRAARLVESSSPTPPLARGGGTGVVSVRRGTAPLLETGPEIEADERRLVVEALEACGAVLEGLPLRRALALESGLDRDWLGLARSARACGQTEEARTAIVEALRRKETGSAHRLLAAVLEELGELAEALAHSRNAVASEPEDPAGWVELARLLVQEGHWEEVVGRWGRQVTEGGALEAGWRLAKELAAAEIHLGEIGQARAFLERARVEMRRQSGMGVAAEESPGESAALLTGWWVLVGGSEVERGREGLNRAPGGGREGAEALYTAGLARLAAGDQAGARDALAQTVALAPSSAMYRLAYAGCLLASPNPLFVKREGGEDGGASSNAGLLARQQLETLRGRGGLAFRRQVAAGWLRLGDAGAAAATLAAVAGETRTVADEVCWAEALLRDGQYEEAANVLRIALGHDGETTSSVSTDADTENGTRREGDGLEEDLRYMLARALLESGETHEAVDLLQGVTRRWPDRADAVVELGRAWEKIGRYELARQAYQRALTIMPDLRDVGDRLLALDAKEQLERAARSGRGAQRS